MLPPLSSTIFGASANPSSTIGDSSDSPDPTFADDLLTHSQALVSSSNSPRDLAHKVDEGSSGNSEPGLVSVDDAEQPPAGTTLGLDADLDTDGEVNLLPAAALAEGSTLRPPLPASLPLDGKPLPLAATSALDSLQGVTLIEQAQRIDSFAASNPNPNHVALARALVRSAAGNEQRLTGSNLQSLEPVVPGAQRGAAVQRPIQLSTAAAAASLSASLSLSASRSLATTDPELPSLLPKIELRPGISTQASVGAGLQNTPGLSSAALRMDRVGTEPLVGQAERVATPLIPMSPLGAAVEANSTIEPSSRIGGTPHQELGAPLHKPPQSVSAAVESAAVAQGLAKLASNTSAQALNQGASQVGTEPSDRASALAALPRAIEQAHQPMAPTLGSAFRIADRVNNLARPTTNASGLATQREARLGPAGNALDLANGSAQVATLSTAVANVKRAQAQMNADVTTQTTVNNSHLAAQSPEADSQSIAALGSPRTNTGNPILTGSVGGIPTQARLDLSEGPNGQWVGRLSQMIAQQQLTGQSLRIALSPAELGAMELTFSGSSDNWSVALNAQQGQTRELLESHLDRIRSMLQDLGVRDAQVSMSNRWAGSEAGDQQQGAPQNFSSDHPGRWQHSSPVTTTPTQPDLDPARRPGAHHTNVVDAYA